MRHSRWILGTLLTSGCLALCLAATSCKKKDQEAAPAEAKVTADRAAAKPAAPTPPDIPEADAREMLNRWLEAQNTGNFDSYKALYAEKFMGVKRVGPRTSRYAREGWLKDRQRMFKKKMSVEAEGVEVNASPTTAEIRFVQHWSSGKFADKGPKRILLVKGEEGLEIAHEEMLRSDLVDSKAASADDFYFLLGGDLVLRDAPLPDKHGPAQPAELDGNATYSARASIDPADLDAATAALLGKSFTTDTGCEAKVTGFYLANRLEPHFGTVQQWECEEYFSDEDCTPATETQIAASVLDHHGTSVMATLDDCDGIYATAQGTKQPVEGEAVESAEIEEKALGAFAALPSVRDQEAEGGPGWWKGIEVVQIFRHPDSGQTLVSVSADNEGTCGEPYAGHWQLWSYDKDRLKPIVSSTPGGKLSGAIDLNSDGSLELLSEGDGYGLERALLSGETLEEIASLSYTYADCPC